MIKNVSLENLGTVNKNKVTIEDDKGQKVGLYFSYRTIIGIEFNYNSYCHTNDWGKTTGKLLNDLEPDKKKRLDDKKFYKRLNEGLALIL